MTCRHWSDCGVAMGGCCALGRYGGKPSLGTCRQCPEYDGPPRGAGDLVAAVTKAVGIQPCGGCKERQKKLNAMLPLG